MRDLIDRRSDDSEVEALLAADVTIEHYAKMEPEIHVGCRQALRPAALVDGFDRLAGLTNGVECGGARAGAILGGKDREHAVADQLQNVARMFVDGRNDSVGIVVEERKIVSGGALSEIRV
jgi:hypothetical protein